jgi:hypothetical protein
MQASSKSSAAVLNLLPPFSTATLKFLFDQVHETIIHGQHGDNCQDKVHFVTVQVDKEQFVCINIAQHIQPTAILLSLH